MQLDSNHSPESLEERLLLVNPVALNSLPGAPVRLYLDFDGHTETDPYWTGARNDGNTGDIVTPAFDLDGDPATFSTGEVDVIREVWARVAEDFRPFNINVTTVDPFVLNDFESFMVSVGGDGDWYIGGGTPIGGIAGLRAFSNANVPNVGFVFSDRFVGSGADVGHDLASAVSHEAGHELGLNHQSTWNLDGTLNQEYNPGNAETAPIMGVGYSTTRDIWFNGLSNQAADAFQNDVAEITSLRNQVITVRPDLVGNTTATATAFNIIPGPEVLNGAIESQFDVDVYSFNTLAATVTIDLRGLDLTQQFPGIRTPGANLDPVLRVLDDRGVEIARADPPWDPSNPIPSLQPTLTLDLPTGGYFLEVSNRREYGNLGQYTLTMTGTDVSPVTMTIGQPIIVEPSLTNPNPGPNSTTGRLTRPAGQALNAPLDVVVTSLDPSEAVIRPTATGVASPSAIVTIPAGQRFVDFFIDAVDDTLLDGDQRVAIHAFVGGILNDLSQVRVNDHEFITVEVNPNPVREDAGGGTNTGGATLTVRRSNTDVDAPNHFVTVDDRIEEYSPSGVLVNDITIEWPGGARPAQTSVRDLVVLPDGNLAVYNGDDQATLSVYNRAVGTWQHYDIAGLSASETDAAAGGIASFGDYVFLTDQEESFGDPRGLIRLDLNTGQFTRFGSVTYGHRLFSMYFSGREILELDPQTGDILNRFPSPPGTGIFDGGLAFDGNSLWLLDDGSNRLYELDPDSGAILDTHSLTLLDAFGNFVTGMNGLAYLDGRLYMVDPFLDDTIYSYNPDSRLFESVLLVGANNFNISLEGGLGAIPGTPTRPGTLIASEVFRDELYEIDPRTGIIIRVLPTPNTFDHEGIATGENGEIFGSSRTAGEDINVYDRDGNFLRTLDVPDGIFFSPFALGGDGIEGLVDFDNDYRDVAAGLAGLIYGLSGDGVTIRQFDPETLDLVSTIILSSPVNAISVDATGQIYGGTDAGEIVRFFADGTEDLRVGTGVGSITDVDVNVSGDLMLTDIVGAVAFGKTDLAGIAVVETVTGTAFGAFGVNAFRPTGDLVVNLTSSDLTELQVPDQIIIPVGSQFVDVVIDVQDDNARDGDQIVTVDADNSLYVSGTTDVTVLDVETILIDVVADDIREDAGPGATTVIVSRSDVDGPFTHIDLIERSVTTPQSILDEQIIESRVWVEQQRSIVTDVNVTLSVNHTSIPDLDVYLVSPSGTRVELFTDLTSNETVMTDTVLDDEAGTRIINGASPYTGRFRPESPLSAFDGENPAGSDPMAAGGYWTLEVRDDNQRHIGTLLSWELEITTAGLDQTTVTVVSNDGTEAVVIGTAVIPVNQSTAVLQLDAIDDDILDGTQIVTVSADQISIAGFEQGSDTVNVLDVENLTLEILTPSIGENEGVAAGRGRVSRGNSDISMPLTVTLSSNDPTEAVVAPTVVIPANAASVEFDIDAVDDAIVDSDQTVTITAAASGYIAPAESTIIVRDHEPKLDISTLTPVIGENAGTITFTVSRLAVTPAQLATDLAVTLMSSDTSAVDLPVSSVVIPAGALSVNVTGNIVDDTIIDGSQTATITATAAAGVSPGSVDVTVTDHETLSVTTLSGAVSVLENAPAGTLTGVVQRSSTAPAGDLIVSLTSSDTSELVVPPQVTIPAGRSSIRFQITVVNDSLFDGDQNVTITAAGADHLDGTLGITVLEHEPPVVTAPIGQTVQSRPTITWSAVPGASRYEIWINDVSDGIGPFIRIEDIPGDTTSFTPDQAFGIGRYRVWVRAFNEVEQPGFWSTGVDFRVRTPPRITGPGGSLAVNAASAPRFTWTNVIDASRYDIWVRNLTTGVDQVIRETSVPATTYTGSAPLAPGRYQVWVRGIHETGDTSIWSDSSIFSVLATPTVLNPVGSTFERRPEIEFETVTGADHYEVWLSSRTTRLVVEIDNFVSGPIFRPDNDLPNGTYVVWVRAVSPEGAASAWSPAREFEVGGPPRILTPTQNAVTGGTLSITWTAVTGTERYDVWLSPLGQDSVQTVRNRNVINTALTISEPLEAGTYRVWVRAISTMGNASKWSVARTFTVAAATDSHGADDAPETILTGLLRPATESADVSVRADAADTESAGVAVEAVPTGIIGSRTALRQDSQDVREPAETDHAAAAAAATEATEADAIMAEWAEASVETAALVTERTAGLSRI